MKSDKQVKEEFRKTAFQEFEKHYPVKVLRDLNFSRKICSNCGKAFWSVSDRKVCGDASCSGGYGFIGKPVMKKKLDYLQAWEEFRNYFKKLKYLDLKRYPVVARWREDVYWVGASVYPFQPFVVSGEIKPPSNAVIIPQLSLRFNDIDNVGITGSHYVCFDMFGQLHFEKKENYDMNLYWKQYFEWITKGMKIPIEELQIHEDAWAGGGTFGPCMEFFSKGMEIGNQVYMQYKVEETGFSELNIKVLDMGQGHERIPWFSTGKSNSYETTFPTVAKRLCEITGFKPDEFLMQKFLPYSALLNLDEIEDIEKVWKNISEKINEDEKKLKEHVQALAAIYSIGEHLRAGLVALNDGALPSNVGGGYNLRTILRRAFNFADSYEWRIDFNELNELHAKFLKKMYPELSENLKDVQKILENEHRKYRENRQRAKQVIESYLKKEINSEKLVELYDSHGIQPEQVKQIALQKNIAVTVPDNFYALVSEKHEKKEEKLQTKKEEKFDLHDLTATEKLYWIDWKNVKFSARVLKILNDVTVVLDKTAFYPTSGGQSHDIGTINGLKVVDVFKQNEIILHKLESNPSFKVGEIVSGEIDFDFRKQLMQHHSGAHLINAAARLVLGQHVWQAGAAKTLEKARLDITHFELLSSVEIEAIEKKANDLIEKNLPVKKEILPREEAEKKFGMRIYQGSFIPGRNLRIVSIKDLDFEACGGTHANLTKEIEKIKILNSNKVQDSIIRINFVAGKAAEKTSIGKKELLQEIALLLNVLPEQVPARAKELFDKWKLAKKGKLKEAELIESQKVEKQKLSAEELLDKTAKILSTQPEHVSNTIKRFLKELNDLKNKK